MVFALIQSEEQYPVDFDDALLWWDCRTKKGKPVLRGNLVRTLTTNYYKDIDYWLIKNDESRRGKGSEPDNYYLTADCFKMMGMQVSGERGRQVRARAGGGCP